MKIIAGFKYYTAKEIGMLVNRTHLTIHLWDTWSKELEDRGDQRLIPDPIRLGKQGTRYWHEDYLTEIQEFAKNIKRGDLAEFSQRQWSKSKIEAKANGNITEKKIIKKINSDKNLAIEEKLICALVYFFQTRDDELSTDKIEHYLGLGKEKINGSVQKLINLNLIYKKNNKIVLFER